MFVEDDYEVFMHDMKTKFPKMFANPIEFSIRAGWWHIIETLCANIQGHINWKNRQRELLIVNNPFSIKIPEEVPQVVLQQVKEKLGGLRFDYEGGDDKIDGMVQMAEAWAYKTCETCGEAGKLRKGGWIRTLCDKHELEYQLNRALT